MRIANNERSYKRLSEVLNRARWARLLDMTAIDDLQATLDAKVRDLADATGWDVEQARQWVDRKAKQ